MQHFVNAVFGEHFLHAAEVEMDLANVVESEVRASLLISASLINQTAIHEKKIFFKELTTA